MLYIYKPGCTAAYPRSTGQRLLAAESSTPAGFLGPGRVIASEHTHVEPCGWQIARHTYVLLYSDNFDFFSRKPLWRFGAVFVVKQRYQRFV